MKTYSETFTIDRKTGDRLERYLTVPPKSPEQVCIDQFDLLDGCFCIPFKDGYYLYVDLLLGKKPWTRKLPENPEDAMPYMALSLSDYRDYPVEEVIHHYFYGKHSIDYNGIVYQVIITPKKKENQ